MKPKCGCPACEKQWKLKQKQGNSYTHPFANIYAYVDHMMCKKKAYPVPGAAPGDETSQHLFKRECAFGECEQCKAFRESPECVMNCPSLWADRMGKEIEWLAYEDTEYDNGHKQVELKTQRGSPSKLREHMLEQFVIYAEHFWTYKWLGYVRTLDRLSLQIGYIYAQSDYTAQVAMISNNSLNCAQHAMCSMSCWAVLHCRK
jgi:hypothetical protein